jgi:hypothetical protein
VTRVLTIIKLIYRAQNIVALLFGFVVIIAIDREAGFAYAAAFPLDTLSISHFAAYVSFIIIVGTPCLVLMEWMWRMVLTRIFLK